MKKALVIILFVSAAAGALGQSRPVDLLIGAGIYGTPKYGPIYSSLSFSTEIEAAVSPRWVLSGGFITAKYIHFDASSSSRLVSNDMPVGNASETQMNLQAKYKIVANDLTTWQIGGGIGLITLINRREMKTPTSSFFYTSGTTDLGFPISTDLYFKLSRRLLAGFRAGTFILPDYPIVGNNFSLQLRYRVAE